MSEEDTKKRPQETQHHQLTLTPSKKPKPPPQQLLSFSPENALFSSDDDVFAGIAIDDEDEAAAQQLISNLLDSPPKTSPFPFKVRFVSYPYLPPSPFECCTSYITINGNEETCGSSFSDSDSSIMASVDTCGVHISDISQSLGFLRVGNDAVFCSDSDEMKTREEEEDDVVWDWSEFLGEENTEKRTEARDY